MSRRYRFGVVLAIALALLASSCRSEDNTVPPVQSEDRVIAAAFTTDDPAKVRVTWFPAPCESFERVEVELDDQYANLTVRVSVDVEECPESSITETVVDLGEALGERRIWDRAFNDTVALDVE